MRILVRELRVLVYAQFLESYKSVRLTSMADSFGVSVDFLDRCVRTLLDTGPLLTLLTRPLPHHTRLLNQSLVSPQYPRELSRFIASGRLSAKIDKVGGVVETSRPDTKNAQYQVGRCVDVMYQHHRTGGWVESKNRCVACYRLCMASGWVGGGGWKHGMQINVWPTDAIAHTSIQQILQEVIKQGDLLLNRLSKLARVVDF